jgi:hypothetical protein
MPETWACAVLVSSVDIDFLQSEAYADAKAALRACSKATEQVYLAVAQLEEARRALRSANDRLAEANRLEVLRTIMRVAAKSNEELR